MAYCLLAVNGEKNALDFVYGLREKRLTPAPQQTKLMFDK